jgi:DNA replication protein DnaC
MTDNLDRVSAANPEEFLLRLLELEVQHLGQGRIEKAIKNGGFYTHNCLKDFPLDEVTPLAQLTRQQLVLLESIGNRENLIQYSNGGTRKTHPATALGIEACKRNFKVAFWRNAALVDNPTRLKNGSTVHEFLKTIKKLGLLISDEWGYSRSVEMEHNYYSRWF